MNEPKTPTPVSSMRLLDDRIWNRSIREEIISALWLIAGLLAWQDGIKWLAWLLFVKSAADTLTAIVFAILEVKIMRRSSNDELSEPPTK